ncbi:putative cytochrome P450 49a1 [Lycorma delicatula]|uniref:putative cytochrome P450 49a1 n=1 Tax=Lycorma delicatula TaxID=130591 RepID=UPI003F51AB56
MPNADDKLSISLRQVKYKLVTGSKTIVHHIRDLNQPLKKPVSIYFANYQERLSTERKTGINIDRLQTDNLLLTPEAPIKKKDVQPSESVKESETAASVTETDVTPSTATKVLQNIATVKNKVINEEPVIDSLTWSPSDKQIAVTKKAEHAVSFEEVPGPESLRIISNVTKLLPVIGMQTFTSLMQGLNHLILNSGSHKLLSRNIRPFNLLFDTYGDVVCLRVPLCGDIIMVQKPEHISEIYKQRNLNSLTYSSFDSLIEWHKNQSKKRFDFIPRNKYEAKKIFWSSAKYHNSVEKISDAFVKRIFAIRNVHDEVPPDFHKELYTWGIECMMKTLFGTQLGFYKVGDMQTSLEAQQTLQSFMDATDALKKCESGLQMWRVFRTSSWERLSNSCESLESILSKHIRLCKLRLDLALKMMTEDKDYKESAKIIKSSLIKALMLSGCVQPEQMLTLCLDMMLVGVNAASMSLGFILYHLAKSPKKQQRLFEEVKKVLPEKNSFLEFEHLREMPYLHACVTESLRLKHPIPYSVMRLSSSMVLNKYFIPAGTYVMTANEISCLKEENFDEPAKFKPERWLDQSNANLENAVVPLSEGTRSFLGRDWLHQQLAIGTAKIIRNFIVDYHYGELKTDRKVLSRPNKPLKFRFEER